MLLPAVGHPGRLDVDEPALDGVGAVKMEPGIEEGRLLAGDDAALGCVCYQAGRLQLRLVRHVDAQPVQVVDVVRVGRDLVLAGALPGEHDQPTHRLPPAQIHHPYRLLGVVVVKDGAVGQVGVLLAVDGQRAVAVLPLLPGVPLVVGPRVAAETLVGH